MCIDLIFGGMRSLPRLHVEDEIASFQEVGCAVLPHAATTENIRALIASKKGCILQFSFHTASDHSHRVFLEDLHGKAHILTSKEFQDLLTEGQQIQHVRLVFISSCHSLALGERIAAAGVRHVVCLRDEASVLDTSCRLFGRHFFLAIAAGRGVQEAFDCGVKALSSSPGGSTQGDARKFVLLPEGGDHS